MPDVREVYEMVTRQKPPAPGAFERQQRRHVRTARNRKLGALAVAAAIALVAVVSVVELGEQRGTTPANRPTVSVVPAKATRPFLLDLGTGERTGLPTALVPDGVGAGTLVSYSASPDGTRLAYGTCLMFSCSGGASDVMGVGNVDGTDVRPLQVPIGSNGYLPRWSPDGTELVYQQRDGSTSSVGNLFVLDLSSGRRTELTDLGIPTAGWWFLSARFSPDGRTVIFHLPSRDGSTWNVWSVPATGGDPTMLLRDAAFPEYLPDGKTIAFVDPSVSSPGGSRLQIRNADGSRRTLAKAKTANGIWWPTVSPDGARIAYRDGSTIRVVDVSTGRSSAVATGDNAEWLGNDTLIVAP